jgi:hypothetical protein
MRAQARDGSQLVTLPSLSLSAPLRPIPPALRRQHAPAVRTQPPMNPKVRLEAGLAAELLHRRQQPSLPQPVAALPFGWAVSHGDQESQYASTRQ